MKNDSCDPDVASSEGDAFCMISARTRRILGRFGWVFVVYYILFATVLMASAFQSILPENWHRTEFLLEILFVNLIYPVLIPAVFVCGGLHNHCTTMLGQAVQTTVFLMGVTWCLTGVWVVASFFVRVFGYSNKA